jgi:dTDP-4-dehydrorhamnose 3,5-epimerase
LNKSKKNDLECRLISNPVFSDLRGDLFESFSANRLLSDYGIDFTVAQITNSRSRFGTLRGVHFSKKAYNQSKIIACTNGKILDLVIDLRQESTNFLKFNTFELMAFDGLCLYIPPGFGHAFLAMEDNTVITYGLSAKYDPKLEFSISPKDELFNQVWGNEIKFLLSEKDLNAPGIEQAIKIGIL